MLKSFLKCCSYLDGRIRSTGFDGENQVSINKKPEEICIQPNKLNWYRNFFPDLLVDTLVNEQLWSIPYLPFTLSSPFPQSLSSFKLISTSWVFSHSAFPYIPSAVTLGLACCCSEVFWCYLAAVFNQTHLQLEADLKTENLTIFLCLPLLAPFLPFLRGFTSHVISCYHLVIVCLSPWVVKAFICPLGNWMT